MSEDIRKTMGAEENIAVTADTAGTEDRSYEELYTQLLGRGDQLHESNKRRIRRGIVILVILPFVLEFIRWLTDSDKVVFLIIWILIMFALSAYLISVEYLDSAIEQTLRDVTDSDAEFDELLPRPDLRTERRTELRTDLHERIRARIESRRAGSGADPDNDEDTGAEKTADTSETGALMESLQEAEKDIEELKEAEDAMEELRGTAPAEIIAAMKEAFDADMHRAETERADEGPAGAGEEDEQ